jgi:endo-1,4-beta-xylanase
MTPENQMKWDATEPNKGQFNYASAQTLVDFAKTNGQKIRGHTLVWHSQLPGWVTSLSGTAVEDAMKNHITNVAGHFKGQIYAWDVVNEVFNEDGTLRSSVFQKNLGQGFIATAFKTAAAADPSAKLYINDYNIEAQNAKSNGLYNLVKTLKSEGVPIHGVGFQTHLSVGQLTQANFAANLKRFSDLGLDVALTEVDIKLNGKSEADQAKAYEDIVKACESVERCVGITIWGITDKYSWITSGSPLPWDSNYKAKAAVASITNAMN